MSTYGEVIKVAKIEFKDLIKLLKTPGEITGRQMTVAAVGTVHLVGAFTLGEIIGRRESHGGVGSWHTRLSWIIWKEVSSQGSRYHSQVNHFWTAEAVNLR